MSRDAGDATARIVGRERELARLRRFVVVRPPSGTLILSGAPGIGKSTLWDAAVATARCQGCLVLVARPSLGAARAPYAGLGDLLYGVETAAAELPPRQARALEVALMRAEPAGVPPEAHTIRLAFASTLRWLARRGALLVAIDDVQWLDGPSAEALAFSVRRLEEPAGFLLAKRPGASSDLERLLRRGDLERIDVAPLGVGAIRTLLRGRLGLTLPGRVLTRIDEIARGNPLFALELGRAVRAHGVPQLGDEIPLPDDVERLIGTRIARLPLALRRALLALALGGELHVTQLEGIAGEDAVDAGVDAGVLLREDDRVRPSHPLLAAAATRRFGARDRRAMHLELAARVEDEALQALHSALATDRADGALAARVAAAAEATSARAARPDAAVLAAHALRLTPNGAAERPERVLTLAACLNAAGEKRRLTELLRRELDGLAPGHQRARGLLALAGGEVADNEEIRRHFEQALCECGDDHELRARILASIADNQAVIRVSAIVGAHMRARQALTAGRIAGRDAWAEALHALAWTTALQGRPVAWLCEEFRSALDPGAAVIVFNPERIAAQRHVWRGELDAARALLEPLLALADERGEPYSHALYRLHLCELRLRAGDFSGATMLLDEWAADADRRLLVWPMYERCRALCAAGRGAVAAAERFAQTASAGARRTGVQWDLLEAARAAGQAGLLAGEPARAADVLRGVWSHTEREGVADPGAFPVAPDLVEALAQTGGQAEASAVAERLAELGERLDHPWARISAARCRGLVAAAVGDHAPAVEQLTVAAEGYRERGLRFDEARSLLALGRVERRRRGWGAARQALDRAADAFDAIGAAGWAREAATERSHLAARRPHTASVLTPAEQRVVELAADGRANKEIAAALFISVHTVEAHLSRAYAKLGVRSRAQLARRSLGRSA